MMEKHYAFFFLNELETDKRKNVFRSPWSNEYDPELSDGAVPSPSLRKLEVAANEAFDTYREMYYEGGVSSVYAFEIDDKFAVVVLIKKGKSLSQYTLTNLRLIVTISLNSR
jgi:hypothetical protein